MNFEELFDSSYQRAIARSIGDKSFFDGFYEMFINSSPEIEKFFHTTDMLQQKEMLKKSFYHLFIFYTTHHVDDYLIKVAKRHSKKELNINPGLYDIWLDCIIKTAEKYDDEFDNDIALAWRLALSPGIIYMQYKYDK